MEKNYFEIMQQKKTETEVAQVAAYNKNTERFSLALSEKEAKELVVSRNASLKKYQRVELGKGILERVIYHFCDSQYINQDNYAESLMKLTDIFYQFKNESMDKLSDEELLVFMREQFENICMGDIEHLADTCLERFSRAIRSGYKGFEKSGGQGEYEHFDEEQRWDKDLYMQVAKELFWG